MKTNALVSGFVIAAVGLMGCGMESSLDRWSSPRGDASSDINNQNNDTWGNWRDRPIEQINNPWMGQDSEMSEVTVTSAALTGQVGDVNVAGDGYNLSGWSDNWWTSVTVYANGANGTAMNAVEISGDLDDLNEGYRETFANDNWETMNDIQVNVVGCSGQSADMWEFDEMAEEVDIEVVDVETIETASGDLQTEMTLQYTAYFRSWNSNNVSSVDGEFVLRR